MWMLQRLSLNSKKYIIILKYSILLLANGSNPFIVLNRSSALFMKWKDCLWCFAREYECFPSIYESSLCQMWRGYARLVTLCGSISNSEWISPTNPKTWIV